MTAGTCRLATRARTVGTVTLMFAAASVIMAAMTLTAVAVGLDGSGTLVDFTVCLTVAALLALASTTALTVTVSHRGPRPFRPTREQVRTRTVTAPRPRGSNRR